MTLASAATRITLLADRGVVRVAGEDASRLLQGVITGDMDVLATQPALYAALLTPQGKILFDFFAVPLGDGFLLETAADKAAELAKRLAMYRLRAKAEIRDVSGDYRVFAAWDIAPQDREAPREAVSFPDPRLPELGIRILSEARFAAQMIASVDGAEATADDYHARRIALGIPEGGKDYAFGEAFPHEADMDQLGGVSFTKGCFVGQEVVSRMQNRAIVRKRIVPLVGDGLLKAGTEIFAGAVSVGRVGSVAGRHALALVRLDRVAEAGAKGEALVADGVGITLRKPSWAHFDLAPATAGA